jgi:hypothetical protein
VNQRVDFFDKQFIFVQDLGSFFPESKKYKTQNEQPERQQEE